MKTNYEEVATFYRREGMILDREYSLIRERAGHSRSLESRQIAEFHPALQRAILNRRAKHQGVADLPIDPHSPLGSLLLEEKARYNFYVGGKRIVEIHPRAIPGILTLDPTRVLPDDLPPVPCFLYFPNSGVYVTPPGAMKEVPINGCYVSDTTDNLDTPWEDRCMIGHYLSLEWVSCEYETAGGKLTNWRTVAHVRQEDLRGSTLDTIPFCEATTPDFKDGVDLHRLAIATLKYLTCSNIVGRNLNQAQQGVATSQAEQLISVNTRLPCREVGYNDVTPARSKQVSSGLVVSPEAEVLLPARIKEGELPEWVSPQYLTT